MTGILSWTADEVPYGTGLLRVEFDVRYTVKAGSPGVHTFANGDPGYPPDPPEIDAVSFWPHAVTDAADEWDAGLLKSLRDHVTAALDRWYGAEERYGLNDAIFDAAKGEE